MKKHFPHFPLNSRMLYKKIVGKKLYFDSNKKSMLKGKLKKNFCFISVQFKLSTSHTSYKVMNPNLIYMDFYYP
jgi:hypothetical protein